MDVAPVPTSAESEAERRTLGQRRVNLIWEFTQAAIALAVTLSTIYIAGRLALSGAPSEATFQILSNSFFLVVGFYFGRTNHQRVGGVDGGR